MENQPKDKQNQPKDLWLRRGLLVFAESTGWIAFPVISALYLGRWLDQKQGTEPLYFLSITALAFIISSVGIGITGVKYMKQIEQEDKKKLENKEKNK
ncbi:AtpZ/AtpI family protein [Candidatus Parcubacteria bacterium]|jgi:hypothetical protein|nr:AtpZ/AtpI family protein [Candidatus Parcubacteria bacterium]MBT7228780.1 AtpZ/AtpI family protein [Candidatus Parcubacteria bacterium]